jgi:methylmalonyl-CoA/ethylmalonyl-CoA epimerase
MPKIKRIHHIAVVVPDLDEVLSFWRDGLGLEFSHSENVPSQKSEVAFFPVGDTEVEFVRPTTEDSGAGKFLKDRGAGLHHLCFEVDDIVGMMALLKEKGIRLLSDAPQELEGRKMAFIHPKSANGVLVELYELTGTASH